MLYGTEEIKQELFSESHIRDINVTLKRNRKRKQVKLSAFSERAIQGDGDGYILQERISTLLFKGLKVP